MNGFSIERTVGLGIIATLLIQSASAIKWGGAAESRLHALEKLTYSSPPLAERLASLEAHVEMTLSSVERLERRLDEKIIIQDSVKTQ